ncbi:TetR/AcrR family transcriptional regulator [Leptospira sp. 2 VSF19]|uniref:TetR/AcrR family transcriptional regulator n=1 Tax=Leptospira soteropolitanensis TaxID=2950025 RepID=A0AAW5VFU6_9LEPT|nr:TetR/AcrR family transcriptional regulator [Leptospira soteropolitanensis]MCW7494281.1 TetR/AcrR family transcriptional regulator [Leptospira soteropolitanensis]MCW7501744.1 TetR/AcrR family transcriptional regulator [Leptospira soteropolitanensis]MCW7524127.1 TetR/AcrR family transcriptional regulator [Leptospira soteropolitanensis]MCW7527992.1 TetR/AcrR family transcriptional regulator [Leptospira soteropolitanensis]MCW7531714.1 TetR/AcrR family transcriptional regulator [Leptospira soter
MVTKHFNDSFERISEEKRNRILSTAISEFANRGFTSANTNTIAQKAGISVGSLYKYFETKEDFFLTVVDHGITQLEKTLESVIAMDLDLFGKIEKIIRIIQTHSRINQDIIRLYNEMTTESNYELITRLSGELESLSAKCYIEMINLAKKEGTISSEVDSNLSAFLLDNIFMTLQFSYSTVYYKERMKIYLGDDVFDKDEDVVAGVMKVIRRALGG